MLNLYEVFEHWSDSWEGLLTLRMRMFCREETFWSSLNVGEGESNYPDDVLAKFMCMCVCVCVLFLL